MSLECKDGCGKCCEVGGTAMILPVTETEAQAVASALGRKIVNFSQHQPSQAHCPAYNIDNGSCNAYDVRPQVCRDFQCNGKDRFTHSADSLDKMIQLAKRIDPVADLRSFIPEDLSHTIKRHSKIAMQFSGGKDSLACLLLLKKHWNDITVYWLNAGDGFPETIKVVRKMQELLPNFVEINSSVANNVAAYGIPSDLVPYGSSNHAHALNAATSILMQDRVACCFRSIMQPMHEQMKKDGITLIIRGQKNEDQYKGALRSGEILDGVEFLYPVENWTSVEVKEFIKSYGYEEQDYYKQGMDHAPECMTCSAWWDDGHGDYLANRYPDKHAEYKKRLLIINQAISAPLKNMFKELA
jgi:phosphoadenosine phosphosulfate reductase